MYTDNTTTDGKPIPAVNEEGGTGSTSPASAGSADVRLTALRKASTACLLDLLAETLSDDALMSTNYFLLAMDGRFRATDRPVLFDLLVTVLRERMPNVAVRRETPAAEGDATHE